MIREMRAQDKETFLTLVREFYASPAVLHAVPEESFARTFAQIVSGSPYAKGYILETDGGPAGYALLALTYSNEVGGLAVWIEEVYIREAFRGQGLGAQFFAWLFDAYQGRAKRFRLELTPENEGAARLYARLGFTPLDYRQMILDAD